MGSPTPTSSQAALLLSLSNTGRLSLLQAVPRAVSCGDALPVLLLPTGPFISVLCPPCQSSGIQRSVLRPHVEECHFQEAFPDCHLPATADSVLSSHIGRNKRLNDRIILF